MWHQGSCHCQQVTFRVNAPEVPEVTVCNCSMCKISNYHHLIVTQSDFELLSGEDSLTAYQFNSKIARHTFCKTCGVKPFYNPRSHPEGVSVNLFCLNPIPDVTSKNFDGQNWEDNIKQLHVDT